MKIQNPNDKYQRIKSHMSFCGQSLFEVVFALGLVSVILIAIVGLSTGSIRNSTYTKNNVLVTQEAQTGTEWLRSQRDADWNAFKGHATLGGKTWCISSLDWSTANPCGAAQYITGTQYKRQVTLWTKDNFPPPPAPPDTIVDTVDAEVVVTWIDSQGTHEVKNQTSYTDWRR